MCFLNYHNPKKLRRLVIFIFLFPAVLLAETRTWTGYGGDTNWSNPLNWSGGSLPQPADDVLLDNRDLPVSYGVSLPDSTIVLRSILINPSPGRNIELVLPATNKFTNAFSVTGPGYGIELKAGAIFRNASGLSSGESLSIADSIMIRDGGRYIHQTRASHANSILRILSTAPGTEQGIFDFDVPKASYTISVSNRVYGSLELHSSAYGDTVNYTCTGANPLLIHGNLRIGANVSMSLNLGGSNGNIQVEGDFIQEGGQLNLASGAGDNTVLRVKGDLYQSLSATITESNTGNPFLELNGERMQEIAMAGRMTNQVGFRMNNISGSTLRLPLKLPWKLELLRGAITSSSSALLILDSGCTIKVDSSMLTGADINGPLRKLGLRFEDHFLFPTGKDGNLRWLELKEARGNYTVEYFHQNPSSIGVTVGLGLHHISKLEYWTIVADGDINGQAKIELSFASAQSGGVSDPDYLNVAKFQSSQWEDAGHTAITGNYLQGSVLSGNTDFAASQYTLASVLDLENPLPLTTIDLEVKEISEKPVFSWTVEGPGIPDHFDLYEESNGQPERLAEIAALPRQTKYSWTCCSYMKDGIHYFRIRMVDIHGGEYAGRIVLFKKGIVKTRLSWLSPGINTGTSRLLIQAEYPELWKYEIITLDGRSIKQGILMLREGITDLPISFELMSKAVYIFRAIDASGKQYSLVFRND